MRERALANIRVEEMRGLEIGPLARPVVDKRRGQVFYVDHADREELRRKYAADDNMRPLLDQIVEVDYVLGADRTLLQAAGPDGPFDYVIASHLIEHIPDLVGWLDDTAALLRPGGILSLIVPDKRYTFDINRRVTDISEVVDAHLRHITRPTPAQAYDFVARALNGAVDPDAAWAGTDYSQMVRADVDNADATALEFCRMTMESTEFLDLHCHVFTPDSFLTVVEKLVHLGLFRYEIAGAFPTERGDIEFFVSLRLLDEGSDERLRRQQQLQSIQTARAVLGPATTDMAVSRLERRAILWKRRALRELRDVRSRWLVKR
ncbi:MAG TPA: methyltransferase domain-containing protein [Acidimicrobiales bacterium]|jgi:SAM-dependent methyltransferase|nr:methyltransferase domain-containing protein [Acidimicrobiales bacterium]